MRIIGLSFMNIQNIFPTESKDVVTVGEVLDGLELDPEEVKWCTDTWLNSITIKIQRYL